MWNFITIIYLGLLSVGEHLCFVKPFKIKLKENINAIAILI